MQNRLYYYSLFIASARHAKFNSFSSKCITKLLRVDISAGLYKPNHVYLQHSLILTSIMGTPVSVYHQTHGKRRKRTVRLNAQVLQYQMWAVLDKLMQELFPVFMNYKTPKWRKNLQSSSYSMRIRQKYAIYEDFEDLVDPILYDSYKGIYLPLTIHFQFYQGASSHMMCENYLRSVKIPASFYTRKPRPAYDDQISF